MIILPGASGANMNDYDISFCPSFSLRQMNARVYTQGEIHTSSRAALERFRKPTVYLCPAAPTPGNHHYVAAVLPWSGEVILPDTPAPPHSSSHRHVLLAGLHGASGHSCRRICSPACIINFNNCKEVHT